MFSQIHFLILALASITAAFPSFIKPPAPEPAPFEFTKGFEPIARSAIKYTNANHHTKRWGSPMRDKPTNLTLPEWADKWKPVAWCVRDDPGVCQLGLVMTWDKSMTLVYVFDNECKVVGASDKAKVEELLSLTSQLPYTVEITPRIFTSTDFYYAGDYYRYGWDVNMLDWGTSYARLPFDCSKKEGE